MVKDRRPQRQSKAGLGGFLRKSIGIIEMRDVLLFLVGLALAVSFLFLSYFVVLNYTVVPGGASIDEVLVGMGITSLFDKIVFFNYALYLSLIMTAMGSIPPELIAVGIFEMIIFWLSMGVLMFLAGLGKNLRILLNTMGVVIGLQLLLIWINPSLAGYSEALSYSTYMLMINGLVIIGIAVGLNLLAGRVLFRSLTNWEKIGNKKWAGEP
jgi:hypothetical protein